MEQELKMQSIVILAQSFNTTIFNRYWLVNNNFVKDEDVNSNSIFTPNVTQLNTPNFSIVVVPEQLQFNGGGSYDFENHITTTLLGILNALNGVPFKAVGFNFNWLIRDEKLTIQELTKNYFYNNNFPLFNEFQSGNPHFGGFLSKDFSGTRMNLDIKPVHLDMVDNVLCNFNFHLDLVDPETAQSQLISLIESWSEFKDESKRLINLF